jgi:uncharacterized iron-regulated membrane protein
MEKSKTIAAQTRWYRKWHKWLGIFSLGFFMLIAGTGLLLAWKKNTNGYLLAKTQTGSSAIAQQWISISDIQQSAIQHLKEKLPGEATALERIDIRPEKGIAKVTFKDHYNAVQVDLATGKPLLLEKRRADFIEHLHDGSILDRLLGIEGPKLLYSTLVGTALLFLSFSGFWLWFNPKRIKKTRKRSDE